MFLAFLHNLDLALFEAWNGSNSMLLDRLMLDVTTWWVWIPLYLSIVYIIMRNNDTIIRMSLAIGMALMCIAFTEIAADVIIKPLVERIRPCNDLTIKALLVNGYKAEGYSFISAHAANTCGFFVYFSLLLRNKAITYSLLSWTLLSCFSRIYLGVHYPSDVFCGMLTGALIGWGVYCLWRYFIRQAVGNLRFISKNITSSGYAVTDLDKVITVLLLTYVMIIIHSIVAA